MTERDDAAEELFAELRALPEAVRIGVAPELRARERWLGVCERVRAAAPLSGDGNNDAADMVLNQLANALSSFALNPSDSTFQRLNSNIASYLSLVAEVRRRGDN